jgi:hypothetical protein
MKSFCAVREEFNNAYPDKEVVSKRATHRLGTKFGRLVVGLFVFRVENAEGYRYGNILTHFISLLEENEGDWF